MATDSAGSEAAVAGVSAVSQPSVKGGEIKRGKLSALTFFLTRRLDYFLFLVLTDARLGTLSVILRVTFACVSCDRGFGRGSKRSRRRCRRIRSFLSAFTFEALFFLLRCASMATVRLLRGDVRHVLTYSTFFTSGTAAFAAAPPPPLPLFLLFFFFPPLLGIVLSVFSRQSDWIGSDQTRWGCRGTG